MVSWFSGRYLRPHWRVLVVIVLLVAGQTIGNLYIPNLNADLINNGVVKGDISYIWRTGALMGVIAVAIGDPGGDRGLPLRAHRDGDRHRAARLGLRHRPELLHAGDGPVGHRVADHPQHQRRPADPELPSGRAGDDDHGPDHRHRRRHPGDQRGRGALAAARRGGPADGRDHRVHADPGHPALPVHSGQDRPAEPDRPRAGHRDPRHPSVPALALRGPPLRRGERRPHRRPRCRSTASSRSPSPR